MDFVELRCLFCVNDEFVQKFYVKNDRKLHRSAEFVSPAAYFCTVFCGRRESSRSVCNMHKPISVRPQASEGSICNA